MKRLTLSAFGVFVAALFTSGFGCELITAPDRSKIGSGGTGGETTSTGGGGTGGTGGVTGGTGGVTGGTGGTGGVTGGGGTGGMPCQQPSDCPDPGNPCVTNTCVGGECGTEPVAAGTLAGNNMAGDCKVFQCNGQGTLEAIDDDADLPVDDKDCTDDVCTAGVPSNPPLASGEVCSSGTGSLCDGTGNCVECLIADDCPGQDTECQTRSCDMGVCGVVNAMQGAPVASQTSGDCNNNQCDGNGAVEAVPDDLDVVNDGNDCTDNTCVAGAPMVANTAIDTACGVGGALKCDGAGLCVGCTGPADCGNGGNACLDAVCNAGTCGTAPKANGTACNDADACTQSDTCQAGACTGASPVICTAQDQCHDVGTCDAANGTCSNPTKANGAACSDGDACTTSDTCQAGACSAGTAVTCMASDQCHDAGTCNPANGTCSNPNKANGAACNDADACTTSDTCQAGACTGASPVTCTALDQCHDVGTCNPANGTCSNPNKMNGAACNDSDACTTSDTCQAGTCTGASPVICMAQDACHLVGTCDTGTGVCSNPNASDGTVCPGGLCAAGTCVSASCGDLTLNGTETDVDCGGSCPTCANGKVCGANGDCASGHCVGNVCVQCAVANDCPGVDNDCQTRTCTANACGFSFQPNGTATPPATQTAGDCHEKQCDGAGNTLDNVLDTDLPNDNKQCTGDVCTAGAASNPNLPLATTCSEAGGVACDGAGNCVSPPAVASTNPADSATPPANTTIAVTFTKAMSPATLTGQTAAGACSGSIQVSVDDFASCVAFSAAAPTMTVGNTVATLTPAPGLLINRTYKIRVTTAVTDAVGLALAATFNQANGFATTNPLATSSGVVISQVYGGGGNTGAIYKNDFIELHNRGPVAVDIGGWAVQYVSGNGAGTWSVTAIPAGKSIPAGGYFLVQEAVGAGGTDNLPTPDVTGIIAMGGTSGKVALTNTATALTGQCPSGAALVDFVGYGAAASVNCSEGSPTGATATQATNTTSAARNVGACTDSDVNNADFTVAVVAPAGPNVARNTATAAFWCSAAQNESGAAGEADYCNTQFPLSLSVQTGVSSGNLFGQIFEAGTTEAAGASATVVAQLGYGSATVNPEYQAGWTWLPASFNVQSGNNDEYQASFTAPAVGSYRYGYRFSLDAGATWTYCDNNEAVDFGAGSNANLAFDLTSLGVLTVTP